MKKNPLTKSIKAWYKETYSSDSMGCELKPRVTFSMLWDAMLRGEDFYTYMTVGDSIIRERIFAELAKRLGVTYDIVYHVWLYPEKIRALFMPA